MFMNDDESAKLHLREALQLSERHGLVSSRAFVLANLTELALKVDDVDAARAHAEAALEVAQGAALMALAGWLKLQLARLAARRGELELARSLLAGRRRSGADARCAIAEARDAAGAGGAARGRRATPAPRAACSPSARTRRR